MERTYKNRSIFCRQGIPDENVYCKSEDIEKQQSDLELKKSLKRNLLNLITVKNGFKYNCIVQYNSISNKKSKGDHHEYIF